MIKVPTADQDPTSKVRQFVLVQPISEASTRPRLEEPTPGAGATASASDEDLSLKLFNNAAAVKMMFGEYLRHLPQEWRSAVFRQVDRLLDIEAWNEESSVIDRRSFRTFLRFIDYARPGRKPSLGVSSNGLVLAAWVAKPQKIFVTFLPDDAVRATLVTRTDRDQEQITAWQGPVVTLKDRIVMEGASACVGAWAR